ncbi:MAG: RluA family pseudouridine synthase [Alphaproteobacteria bacterium]
MLSALIADTASGVNIENHIIYEHAGVIAINKPSRTISTGNSYNSISELIKAFRAASFVPQVAHRLDVNTTGVFLIACEREALSGLKAQFKDRTIKKEYWALLDGVPENKSGRIDSPIPCYEEGSHQVVLEYKKAVTNYYTLQTNDLGMSFVRFQPYTGRTHQLRIHSADCLKAPIIGDRDYHKNFYHGLNGRNGNRMISHYTKAALPMELVQQMDGQMLHARSIKFIHPLTGKKVFIEAPLPANRENIWKGLNFDPSFKQNNLAIERNDLPIEQNDPVIQRKEPVKMINGSENVRKWREAVKQAMQDTQPEICKTAQAMTNSIVEEFSGARHLKRRDVKAALERYYPETTDRAKALEYLLAGF